MTLRSGSAEGMAKVLVIDDEPDARDALCRYLGGYGHVVECVDSGNAAIPNILANPPDVIVLDLLMPGMDGPAFLEVIRGYIRLRSIPVIVWTGAGEGPVLERIRGLSVQNVLIKPGAAFSEIRSAIEAATNLPP